MNFTPENLAKVLRGDKTQTRRFTEYKSDVLAVCPGRGKPAVAYVRVIRKWQEPIQDISVEDAVAEGIEWRGVFRNEIIDAFRDLWDSLYGGVMAKQWADNPTVWCYEFELMSERTDE